MSRLCLLISMFLVLYLSWACDDNEEEEELLAIGREDPENYYAYAYGFTPETWRALYQQPRARVPEYSGLYEGRTQSRLHTFTNPLKSKKIENADKEHRQPEGRFALGGLGANLINTGFFNSRFTPTNTWKLFQNLASRIPISYNPNADSPFDTFESCISPNGDAGICAPGLVCSLFGGRPSGSCILGKVCCIRLHQHNQQMRRNSHAQQHVLAISDFPHQRSDNLFVIFQDGHSAHGTVKETHLPNPFGFNYIHDRSADSRNLHRYVKVGQTNSKVPTICGDNVYLDIPSSAVTPSNVQLMFTFSEETAVRLWNIKIALLPSGAFYLAPVDCLQYFTAATGRVRSFNWLDTNSTTIRQLNNQTYNICFRTELIAGL